MQLPKSLSEKVAYHKQRSHRIEALADGVFAIVMTLLVLDIRVPVMKLVPRQIFGIRWNTRLPKILTFFLSFSVAVSYGQFLQTSLTTSNF